jgi:hypothetical protein
MDTQLTLSEQLAVEGMAASENNVAPAITRQVDRAIDYCARFETDGFTSEDVRLRLGHFGELASVSKVIGSRMNSTAKAGRIYTRGETRKATRAEAHARRLLVWYRKDSISEVMA